MLAHNRDIATQLVIKLIERRSKTSLSELAADADRVARAYQIILGALQGGGTKIHGEGDPGQ